jgi:hypothetical protein
MLMLLLLCWWFVLQVVSEFYKDTEWVAAYDTSIPADAANLPTNDGTFWGSKEGHRLAALIAVLNFNNGAWELCIDWVCPHKGTSYSVGVIGIRCVQGLAIGSGIATSNVPCFA